MRTILDCGCCIDNGHRTWCPSCLSPPPPREVVEVSRAQLDIIYEGLGALSAVTGQAVEAVEKDNLAPLKGDTGSLYDCQSMGVDAFAVVLSLQNNMPKGRE